ncbi:MAG: KEOPS complex subunit Cgi121 [Thermoplasmatota archaeon]
MTIIIGARGRITSTKNFFQQINEFSKKHNVIIQIVNADYIYGKDHIISAFLHTQRSFLQNTNSLDDVSLELLLYISGERQISKAIEKVGITSEYQRFAIILIPQQKHLTSQRVIQQLLTMFKFTRDDTILDGDKNTLQRFGITIEELSTIPNEDYGDIILEKVALVDVIK